MRIGIDCRLAGRQHAGIGRYTAELVRYLVNNQAGFKPKSPHTFVLTVASKAQAQELFLKPPNFVEWAIAPVRHYSLKEQLVMPRVFARQKLDLLHVPHFNLPLLYRGKVIVTIHDLLWHHQIGGRATTLPVWQYWLKYGFYRLIVARTVARARSIIVPSKQVAGEVKRYYPPTEGKIKVIPEGVSIVTKNQKSPRTKPPHDYLLYVGSLYPHKNIKLVLQALQLNPKLKLVIVTARSAFSKDIQEQIGQLKIKTQVKFYFHLPDRKLAYLYSHAVALIQPSLSEGFGLTGLEAMACSTPVLASNIPIFREVYDQAAIFFDPYHPKSLLDAIKSLPTKRQDLVKQGLKRSTQFSWKKMAAQIFELYQAAN
jgi:glycosyltransferase involved in cell wall biosynthesis